jgi:ribosomal protein S18 acetylase RimI-like enzyme
LEQFGAHAVTFDKVGHDLRDLDPDCAEDVAAISELHEGLLPSGVAGLGTRFLRQFFYSRMVREGLIKAALSRIDGDPAGFITMTQQPSKFLNTAITRHWPTVIWHLAVTSLRRPVVLTRLVKLLRINAFRIQRPELSESAQILAIGVRPKYRHPHFVRSTGIRIAPDLVQHAVTQAIALGLREIHLEIDASDRRLLVFYRLLGWQSERYMSDSGVPIIKVHLDLTAPPGGVGRS